MSNLIIAPQTYCAEEPCAMIVVNRDSDKNHALQAALWNNCYTINNEKELLLPVIVDMKYGLMAVMYQGLETAGGLEFATFICTNKSMISRLLEGKVVTVIGFISQVLILFKAK